MGFSLVIRLTFRAGLLCGLCGILIGRFGVVGFGGLWIVNDYRWYISGFVLWVLVVGVCRSVFGVSLSLIFAGWL